jgi:hypothetical protein
MRKTIACNLGLQDIVTRIVSFFEQRGIAVKTVFMGNTVFCKASPSRASGLVDSITVVIELNDGNLTLSFESSRKSRLLTFFGKTFAVFGAGFFALLGLKSEEELERLESEFWDFVKNLV